MPAPNNDSVSCVVCLVLRLVRCILCACVCSVLCVVGVGVIEQHKSEKQEIVAKDEHVRVLSQQNQQMLELLEQEERKSKQKSDQIEVSTSQSKEVFLAVYAVAHIP